MTDFEFYALNYRGAVIPDEQAFSQVITDATAFVDALISHREYLAYGENMTKYQNAVCSVAEEMYNAQTVDNSKEVASESVGNHSKSYVTRSRTVDERQTAMRSKAKMHLVHTGLLYRGG